MVNRNEKIHEPEIAIVIGTLNRPKIVLKLITQLQQIKNIPFEVLVYDQSNDMNYRKLINQFPQISPSTKLRASSFKLFHLNQPNTCQYLNLGWQKAKAPIILYLDDDVEITEDTIIGHLQSYKNDMVLGVAGKVINQSDHISSHFRSTTVTSSYSVNDSVECGQIKSYGAIFIKNFSSEKKGFVDFPYGCNMSFRRKTLEEFNGFDEKLSPPIYSYNEVDLGYRISSKYPQSIIFEPKALVYHQQYKSGGTRTYTKSEIEKSNAFNYGYFIGKNFSWWQNILFLIRRLPYQLFYEPNQIINIIKGYIFSQSQKNHSWSLLVLFIFGLIAFLRFWKVPELFNFTFSEENQAHMAWEQIKNFHLIWIGVSAANVNYYLGPGFTYLNYLLFIIWKDPVILSYFSACLGFATTISLYFIVKEIYNKEIALFSAILYGCSTLLNFHDRRFWNATLIPFITIWYIYSLFKAKQNTRWYIVTAFLVGCFFHTHLSLLLLGIPTMYSLLQNFRKIKFFTWISMIGVYLAVTSPLIVFDFVHNFDNILMPFRTLFGYQKADLNTFTIQNIYLHIQELLSAFGRFWFFAINTNPQEQIVLESHYGKTIGNIFLSLLSIFAVIMFFIKNKQQNSVLIKIAIITIITAFIFYPSYNPEYYLMSLLILLTIAIAFCLYLLPNKIRYFILFLFIIFNIVSTVTMSDRYGLSVKKKLIQKTIISIANSSFSLETYGELPNPQFAYAGWRFLFKVYGRTPHQSNIDSVLGYLYKDELSKIKPKLKIILVDTIKPKFTEIPIKIVSEGDYTAYVFTNY